MDTISSDVVSLGANSNQYGASLYSAPLSAVGNIYSLSSNATIGYVNNPQDIDIYYVPSDIGAQAVGAHFVYVASALDPSYQRYFYSAGTDVRAPAGAIGVDPISGVPDVSAAFDVTDPDINDPLAANVTNVENSNPQYVIQSIMLPDEFHANALIVGQNSTYFNDAALVGGTLPMKYAIASTPEAALNALNSLSSTTEALYSPGTGTPNPITTTPSNPTHIAYPPFVAFAGHQNDLGHSSTASGQNHFIDTENFEASFPDLITAFGTNQPAMVAWYSTYEPSEQRVETFDGLDYVASYNDLIEAFKGAGSMQAVQDAGANHFITNGLYEGRTTSFNGLDYIASYSDLSRAFGANSDAGAYHYIENGKSEGRTTTFNGLDYIASYRDLIDAFGANEQAGAAHYIIDGRNEGRQTSFNGLSYIASNLDLMTAFGSNSDAGAAHFIIYGHNEGRQTSFNVGSYEASHPDLIGHYATNNDFLTAYINTYKSTGHALM